MKKKVFSLARVYTLLEPGPVVLLSTAGPRRPNVMAMSWHAMVEFEPALLSCIVSDRNYSFGLLQDSGECVLNIPTADLARQVVGCGNTRGTRTDKFRKFGLTPSPAQQVAAPLIDECYASLECRVADTRSVSSYGLFILEVVKAWVAPDMREARTLHHRGRGHFGVLSESITLRSKK